MGGFRTKLKSATCRHVLPLRAHTNAHTTARCLPRAPRECWPMASCLQAAVALDSFARRWSRSVTSTSRCGRARAVERGAVAGRRAQAGRATRARASNSTVVLPAAPAPTQVVFRARRRRRQGHRVQLRAVRQAAHAHAPADGGAAAAAAVRTGLAAAVQRRRHRRHEDDVAGRRAAAQAAHFIF
jgi:hypothetical protein